jgi:transcription initiation factor TFIIE subunit alpha
LILLICKWLTRGRHNRAEIREGQQRPQTKTYYYIDYRASIDAIKWRVYLIDKEVQGTTIPTDERKEYFCGRCKSEWTVLEVVDKWDHRGFLCHKCGNVLQHDPDNNRGGHEQSTRLNAQFKFITDLLPKIDQVIIPENNFEQAIASSRPVVRDATNPASEMAPVTSTIVRPTAVKGMANTGPTSINVTLTTSDGPTKEDIAAEKARKEAIAAQNVLPVHFTHSTISGEQVKFGEQPTVPLLEPEKKDLGLDTPSVNGDGAEIDDYFARLKAEQAKEAEKEQDEEYETDEEDEDDFEDVVPSGTGAATPASSIGVGDSQSASMPPGNGLTSALKKSGSASASGTSTGVTSPVTGPGTPNEDGRPSKKVRIEEPNPKGDDEESEEDMEFEDAS